MNAETHKRADPKLIARCKADYLTGRGTIEQCAERYGLTPVNIRNIAAREGWKQTRDIQFLAMVAPMKVDFESRLQAYRTTSLGMIGKMEEKLDAALNDEEACKKYGPKELSQLTSALETLLTTKRDVLGIPRIGAAKPPTTNEKSIPAETEPIEAEALEPGTPEYENAITPMVPA